MDWHGRTVWIVGASSGIGAAVARELGSRGARLVLSARNAEALQEVAAACAPAEVRVLPLDLERPEPLPSAAAEAWATWDGLDVVLLNAGVAHRDLAENTSLAVDRRIMEVDYFGPVTITKALLPRFLARGRGHVAVTSSLSGKYGVPRTSAYAAAKHALHGFFDTLRAETHDRGLRVTLLIPGFVATDITRHALDGGGAPHGRMLAVQEAGMPPDECARRIVRALEREAVEVAIGRSEIWSLWVARAFPRLWMWIIRNHPIRRLRRLGTWLPTRHGPRGPLDHQGEVR